MLKFTLAGLVLALVQPARPESAPGVEVPAGAEARPEGAGVVAAVIVGSAWSALPLPQII